MDGANGIHGPYLNFHSTRLRNGRTTSRASVTTLPLSRCSASDRNVNGLRLRRACIRVCERVRALPWWGLFVGGLVVQVESAAA